MPDKTYYHLKESDYPVAFPASADPVPVMLDKHTFFDDWIMNRIFSMTLSVETFILDRPDIFG